MQGSGSDEPLRRRIYSLDFPELRILDRELDRKEGVDILGLPWSVDRISGMRNDGCDTPISARLSRKAYISAFRCTRTIIRAQVLEGFVKARMCRLVILTFCMENSARPGKMESILHSKVNDR